MRIQDLFKKQPTLYLVYGEDITTSGIIRNQVLPLLIRLATSQYRPTLVSIVRPDFQIHQERWSQTSEFLARNGISLLLLREEAEMAQTVRKLVDLCHSTKPVLVHCRSYYAALYAGLAKQETGIPFIFDLRGRMPEEQKLARDDARGLSVPGESDPAYEADKRMEAALLSNADVSIVQNHDFTLAVERGTTAKIRRMVEIQNFVDIEKFQFQPEARASIRAQEGWGNKPILGFSGSMSPWCSFDNLVYWASVIQREIPDCQLLFLTYIDESAVISKNRQFFQSLFTKYGVDPQTCHFRNPCANEVPKWLSVMDAGILSLKRFFFESQHCTQPIKVGEYLGNGLPFIGNDWETVLQDLTTHHPETGWVVPDETIPTTQLQAIVRHLRSDEHTKAQLRTRIAKVARQRFSLDIVASKYIALYKSLLSAVVSQPQTPSAPRTILYSHYGSDPTLPPYVQFALEKLASLGGHIVLLTNSRPLNSSVSDLATRHGIELIQYENEGYDFGMWYKYLSSHNMESVQRLMLINDSIVYYRNIFPEFFSWAEQQDEGLCGLTTNEQPEYNIPLHMQSFLLYFKGAAVQVAIDQIKAKGILHDIQDVIHQHEIGLSQHLISKGYKIKPMFPYRNYPNAMRMYKELAEEGSGFIKKKMLTKRYTEPEMQWLWHIGYNDYVQFDYRSILVSKNLLADGFRPEDLP